MIAFQIQAVTTGCQPWVFNGVHRVESHKQLKQELGRLMTQMNAGTTISLAINADFTRHQVCNYIALCRKSWDNLQFMAGHEGSAPANPWRSMRNNEALDLSELSTRSVTITPTNGVIIYLLCGVTTVEVICAFAYRMLNMAEWCIKYGSEIKLTSDTVLKRETFDAITRDVKPALTPQARAESRVEPVEPEDEDESEGEDPEEN